MQKHAHTLRAMAEHLSGAWRKAPLAVCCHEARRAGHSKRPREPSSSPAGLRAVASVPELRPGHSTCAVVQNAVTHITAKTGGAAPEAARKGLVRGRLRSCSRRRKQDQTRTEQTEPGAFATQPFGGHSASKSKVPLTGGSQVGGSLEAMCLQLQGGENPPVACPLPRTVVEWVPP